ncbi:T9SS type A sorting domain-containing protein [bacterium]|nr:T9SS type A sorting domain-containing protein [bacterium]MBU1650875.1 T9SS type A sorting domain-containing protein [bacterium]
MLQKTTLIVSSILVLIPFAALAEWTLDNSYDLYEDGATNYSGYSVWLERIDSDAYVDMITGGNYSGQSLSQVLFNLEGTYNCQFGGTPEVVSFSPKQIRSGYIRGTSNPKDIVMADGVIKICENEHDGELQVDQTISYDVDWIALGKIDDDSYDDLAGTPGSDDETLYIWRNTSGSISSSPTQTIDVESTVNQVQIANLSDDYTEAFGDVVVATGGDLYIYDNNGSGTIGTTPDELTVHSTDAVVDFAIGDLNWDGYNDIVACTYYKVYFFFYDGGFSATPDDDINMGGGVEQVAIGQIRATGEQYDGWADLAVCTQDYAYIFPNNQDETFNTTYGEYWLSDTFIGDFGMGCDSGDFEFADLRNKGGLSLIGTGYGSAIGGIVLATYVFKDATDPAVTPIQNVQAQESAGGYAQITWEASTEPDIDKYTIYRALMDTSTSIPEREDFDSLSTINHPTCTYTDTEVEWHSQSSNYFVWYAVTGIDDEGTECGIVGFAKGWGYYSNGDICETIFFNQPDHFSMSAAPNPFNPTTTLRYEMPSDAHVTLKVFDVAGREVATLMDAYREAGTHNLTWNAGHLPSGVYFAHIRAGEFSSIQKLMLVK